MTWEGRLGWLGEGHHGGTGCMRPSRPLGIKAPVVTQEAPKMAAFPGPRENPFLGLVNIASRVRNLMMGAQREPVKFFKKKIVLFYFYYGKFKYTQK